MSVEERSCAARILFNFSGCEESEGGERRRVRCVEERPDDIFREGLKSASVSKVTEGAMMTAECRMSSLSILKTKRCV